MTPISLTGAGALITIIELALQWFGVDLPQGSIAAAVNGLFAFGGVTLLVWRQLSRADLIAGIVRK